MGVSGIGEKPEKNIVKEKTRTWVLSDMCKLINWETYGGDAQLSENPCVCASRKYLRSHLEI